MSLFKTEITSNQVLIYSFFTLLIFTIIGLVSNAKSKRKKLPPGPNPLPIIGNLYQISAKETVSKIFTKWADDYGNIFTMYFGWRAAIVLNDAKSIQEAFNNPFLNGRHTNKVIKAMSGGNYGLVSTEGEDFFKQKKFTMKYLKNIGFGTNELERIINIEAKLLVESFESEGDVAFDPAKNLTSAILNLIWRIVAGSRFCDENNGALEVLETFFGQLDEAIARSKLFMFPILADIAPEWSGFRKLEKVMGSTFEFLEKIIKEHEATRNESFNRDFIDAYLEEISKAQNDPSSSFHKEKGYKNLSATIGELFVAGSETTSNFLSWALLYLSVYPEIQEKFAKEIESVIGHNRSPLISDKLSMPYTEALIQELFRISAVASIGIIHRATQETAIGGFYVPKDTVIISHLHRVHHDPKTWENPHLLNPDRFLVIENGALKFMRSDIVIPFSTGKRACLGGKLARDTAFIFLTSIYQRFSTELDPEGRKVNLEPRVAFIEGPHPYKIVLKDRNRH